MKRTLILLSLLPLVGIAQTFERGIKAASGEKIGFLEFRPWDYKGQKHPLIIFLHGVGEKGNGTSQLNKVKCCGIPAYIRAGHQMRFTWQGKTESFVVLSPQLSKKYRVWQPFYTDELIKYAIANLNIDPDRIFVTGLSLGGGGTWNFASSSKERAERLAGIAPVVAPCMMANACNISTAALPVMAIHSWDDRDAPPSCTVNAIKSINSCNPAVSPNLIMYPNGGHYVWVRKAFDTIHSYQEPNLYEWFLAQNRKFAPNKKPYARAGNDVTVTTGEGTVSLDAGNSSDPDGNILRYIWTKISGPTQVNLADAHSATAKVTKLTTKGTYKFQLKVVDNRAEWSLDTITVNVEKGEASPNRPPVANAGTDIIIELPLNSANLDGSASYDPDGTITSIVWTRKDGPSKFRFADAWNTKTKVDDLEEGVYTFSLKIKDNRGAVSTDDVMITVKRAIKQEPVPDSLPGNNNGEQEPGEVITPQPPAINSAVALYPNPSRSNTRLYLNFVETGNVTVTIYDIWGRAVKRFSLIKTQQLLQQIVFTGNLGGGIYTMEVLTRTSKRNLRFVKH